MRVVEDDSFCQEELHGSNVVLLRQVRCGAVRCGAVRRFRIPNQLRLILVPVQSRIDTRQCWGLSRAAKFWFWWATRPIAGRRRSTRPNGFACVDCSPKIRISAKPDVTSRNREKFNPSTAGFAK